MPWLCDARPGMGARGQLPEDGLLILTGQFLGQYRPRKGGQSKQAHQHRRGQGSQPPVAAPAGKARALDMGHRRLLGNL